jgi:putative hydrolase of the HAD superfamily
VNNKAMPRALLFDLDDTLIDDSTSVGSAWNAVCEEAAVEAPGLDAVALLARIHEVRGWYWSDAERHRIGRNDLRAATAWIVEEALRRLDFASAALAPILANRYRDIREEQTVLLPGAMEAIDRCREAGIALALLTNGSSAGQRTKLERFDLAQHFDYISIEGEFGYGKPDERVYTAAIEALSCRPAEAWMVGDNLEWDVAAPMRLGLKGVWYDRFEAGLPADSACVPDRIIRHLDELP